MEEETKTPETVQAETAPEKSPEFSVSTTGQSGVKDDDAFIRKVMGLK